ncbi:maltokinase N-terminal cap-like domain-containing protein [Microbacterium sp.]|uniref:maltokinase N-terminal cap-like domain-containing protein n=1 Tax=Microbacterium sp. TaxID=51671 RepID=UPI0039E5921C
MDRTLACLAAWMPQQRWYAAKGARPALRLVSWWDLPVGDTVARTYLVADEGSSPAITYQVPTILRPAEQADPGAVIGHPEPGVALLDAPRDPAFAAALLRLITAGGRATGSGLAAVGHPALPAPPVGSAHTAAVLSGEQSNTSIVYRPAGEGIPIIAKLFRQVHAGLNPDVELTSALAAAGSPFVARAIGAIEGEWTDALSHRPAGGSLAFAQEFLPGVEDAWRVALRAAAADDDFSARARALGGATARVHAGLADLFPTRAVADADREATVDGWRRRLAAAIDDVPALAAHVPAIEAVYAAAAAAPWPALQRVHGDYHLGQVILVPGRGWVLLDFEGEPMRPMSDRLRPDLAARDVAGMLRSFDYVTGALLQDEQHPPVALLREWTDRARAAFLAGYRDAAVTTAADTLLSALELDKAVYETSYEARNRPAWVPIPLGAVARLAGGRS